jgi:hypothetical protein
MSKLNHPNVMGYYGYHERNGPDGIYYFLELCPNGHL